MCGVGMGFGLIMERFLIWPFDGKLRSGVNIAWFKMFIYAVLSSKCSESHLRQCQDWGGVGVVKPIQLSQDFQGFCYGNPSLKLAWSSS